MGCSASRTGNFITQQQNPTSSSSSSHSNSRLQSPSSPPLKKGDSNHFVSLTSTTYGLLVLIDPPNISFNGQHFANPTAQMKKIQDCGNSEDPLSPDSVINALELMEGLDEEEIYFHMVEMDASDIVNPYESDENMESKPLWKHLSEESLLAKMDSNVVSSYRKALLGRHNGCEKTKDISKPAKIEALEKNDASSLVSDSDESGYLWDAKDRIVLYYTSLRGIRKTYEDCCAVRVIFRCFRVCVDEKDISMDRSYRKELQDALKVKAVSLPQVFIKGRYIGSAEEIKELNEAGELAKLLEGFPLMDLGFVCESCGDARFLPCSNCNGSRKVYEEEEGKTTRCSDCNENGLIRCSGCCH
ncbi:hypothetical protein Pfo_003191 [Paulownia fortunei]|nr:hypothetical protein Pfo_003191 [Paulownia fortunei]